MEMGQSWRDLTTGVISAALLMSTLSGFRRLRLRIRMLKNILFALRRVSVSILDTALTTSTTLLNGR